MTMFRKPKAKPGIVQGNLVLVFFFCLLSFLGVSATPQFPEILIYEGKEYPIQNDLLENYFDKFAERNPKKEDERCSALWRGNRATYEVLERRIFLKDVHTGVCQRNEESQLKKVVPHGERLAIDWYSGLLVS